MRAMSSPVTTGTISSHGDMWNVEASACSMLSTPTAASAAATKPAAPKTASAMAIEGTVVRSMYRMCVNMGTCAVEEARTVVSLMSEILSPKYAPEIMAPAIHPSSKPRARPMPMRATPMVATVVHDDPVSSETTAQMMHEAMRNIDGWRAFNP